jgi:RNA polymerase sigma-70 factor (ECF subfamily)
MSNALSNHVAELYREHYREVLAPLVRLTGSFERAEEAAQESFVVALQHWAGRGVPDEPVPWLRRVARNRAIDVARRGARWADKVDALKREATLGSAGWQNSEPDPERIEDDLLRLVFTCCHPALPARDRIALTLHTVCGLTSDEVARSLLVSRATLQQRLLRAKRKIAVAGIPYVVPTTRDMPARLQSVLQTFYLVFTEGYSSTNSERLVRDELCNEAIRLVRLLRRVLPGRSEVDGLLALMLMHHARSDARTDSGGRLVRLADQDRATWDHDAIAEARPLVESSLRARPLSRYAVEAAIAALHNGAERAPDTDWGQIVQLYDVLLERGWGGPIVELNRAVALAFSGSIEAGLRELDLLDASGALAGNHLLPVARAELLGRLGRREDALAALESARELVVNPVERTFLDERIRDAAC